MRVTKWDPVAFEDSIGQRDVIGMKIPFAHGHELRALIATLQNVVTTQEIEIKTLKEQIEGPKPSDSIPQGTVLAVNQAWYFVVLNLGGRQGIAKNTEMLVQRGNQLIGKVRVTSIETSTSIADIVVRSLPRGLSVMPGDAVIQQTKFD